MSYPVSTFPGNVPQVNPGQTALVLYPAADPATDEGATYNHLVQYGKIDPGCPTCQTYFGTPDAPNPNAMAPRHRCTMHGRVHCTMSSCF